MTAAQPVGMVAGKLLPLLVVGLSCSGSSRSEVTLGRGSMLRAIVPSGDGFLVGWDERLAKGSRVVVGHVSRFGRDGERIWDVELPWLQSPPMAPFTSLPGEDANTIIALTAASDGGAAVLSADLGEGGVLTRIAPDGGVTWQRRVLESDDRPVDAVAMPGDEIAVLAAGWKGSSISVLGRDGSPRWRRSLDPAMEHPHGLARTANGNFVVVGTTYPTTGSLNGEGVMLVTDELGARLRLRDVVDERRPADGRVHFEMAMPLTGGYLVGGSIGGRAAAWRLDADGATVWTYIDYGSDTRMGTPVRAAVAVGNELVLIGPSLVRLSPDGTVQWKLQERRDEGEDAIAMDDGAIVLESRYEGSIFRLDGDGHRMW